MGPAAGAAMAAGDFVTSLLNWGVQTDLNASQHDYNKEMLWRENEYNTEMWNKTNEYNSPLNQRKRLEDAGLNPLYFGLDGSSASMQNSAQALPFNPQAPSFHNPVESFLRGQQIASQKNLIDKQAEDLQSQIDKRDEEKAGLRLDNAFKQRTLDARVEGEQLAPEIMKVHKKEVEEKVNAIKQNIQESIQRAKTEEEKRNLMIAQEALAKASEKQILELLPYEKNLKEAQTLAERMAASASFYNGLYTKGLIDAGQIDLVCDQLRKSITLQGEQANLAKEQQNLTAANAIVADFKASIRNGTTFKIDENDNFIQRIEKRSMNKFYQNVSRVSEVLVGPLANLIPK